MFDGDVIIILNFNNCGELRACSRSQRNLLFSVLSSFSQQVSKIVYDENVFCILI